jgi:hypothetical protein
VGSMSQPVTSCREALAEAFALLDNELEAELDLYAQATTEDKRDAQNGLASLIMGTQNHSAQTGAAA